MRPGELLLPSDLSILSGVNFSSAKFFGFVISWLPCLLTESHPLVDVSVRVAFGKQKPL